MPKFFNSFLNTLKVLRDAGPLNFYCAHIPNRLGLIHVGAHLGEERTLYKGLGFSKVFWIEANPEVYEKLRAIVGEENCALALVFREKGILLPFNISNNSVSSSVYELSRENPWAHVEMVSEIQLISTTLDDLLYSHPGLDSISSEALLVMDIQGAEMPALQGASELLSRVSGLVIEISKKKTYEGGTDFHDLDQFLKLKGFRRMGQWVDVINGHGDALYLRKNLKVNYKIRMLAKSTYVANVIDFIFRALSRRSPFKKP